MSNTSNSLFSFFPCYQMSFVFFLFTGLLGKQWGWPGVNCLHPVSINFLIGPIWLAFLVLFTYWSRHVFNSVQVQSFLNYPKLKEDKRAFELVFVSPAITNLRFRIHISVLSCSFFIFVLRYTCILSTSFVMEVSAQQCSYKTIYDNN